MRITRSRYNLPQGRVPPLLRHHVVVVCLLPDGSHLNCLLYADDLLLISTSAEGLQQSLDRLLKYCQDWLLKINPTKTKVIVFQKKSRKSAIGKHNFMVSNENIEIVNNYTYLGVKFSANGNVTNHKENLTEKTKRSFFAARRYLDFLKLQIHIINKLFNTPFFPILTYCPEVWGIYDKSDYSRWDKDFIEKTHIHFCKMCLGLNKRSPSRVLHREMNLVDYL